MKMEELADFALDYCNFYFEDFSRHPVNHIARVIFCIALSDKIKEDINHRDSCYAIMISIRRRFTTFSRAAQINRWAALKSIECDQGVPATTIAATY